MKKCNCGLTPTKLIINETSAGQHALVSGSCCAEWQVEFTNGYAIGTEQKVLAQLAWDSDSARLPII